MIRSAFLLTMKIRRFHWWKFSTKKGIRRTESHVTLTPDPIVFHSHFPLINELGFALSTFYNHKRKDFEKAEKCDKDT